MRKFAKLFEKIDQTQSSNEKVLHLKDYFSTCGDADGAWALFFLTGNKIKRLIGSKSLLEWCCRLSSIPTWLMEESYAAVGDTAETISLILSRKSHGKENPYTLAQWMDKFILPLRALSLEEKEQKIIGFWSELSTQEIFIFNKILTGAFRVGVSSLLTLKALSQAVNIPREILTQRLMGTWEPTESFFASLKAENQEDLFHHPYPFYLAYPFERDLPALGSPLDWLAEWKWDGIRAQAVIRKGACALWSRGNELISEQFPELLEALNSMDDGTVLDGEILAYENQTPLPFSELQKRLGRKNVSKTIIKKVPVIYMVYDLLEHEGQDLRTHSLFERRRLLPHLKFPSSMIQISKELDYSDWETLMRLRLDSRKHCTEGIMLKKWNSTYGVGRQKGFWWKYKVDPLTIDAVLLYAQAGSGRRANLFTDYTFGIWKDHELIPISKAYSGLNQAEIDELDSWIRKNTEEKFGPVRKVKPFHVFEIAFEGIQMSKRHKSGVALRFPRIARWRRDKPCSEADSLTTIKESFFHEK